MGTGVSRWDFFVIVGVGVVGFVALKWAEV